MELLDNQRFARGVTPDRDQLKTIMVRRLKSELPPRWDARRIIADRCLYGVDKNSMAVDIAKLSLWLITLRKDCAFTFLDHALRCGDSLLGVTDVKQIEYFDLNPQKGNQLPIVSATCMPLLQQASAKRRELESFTVNDIHDLQRKEELLREAELALDQVRFIGDLLIGKGLTQSGRTGDEAEDLDVLSLQVTNRHLRKTM